MRHRGWVKTMMDSTQRRAEGARSGCRSLKKYRTAHAPELTCRLTLFRTYPSMDQSSPQHRMFPANRFVSMTTTPHGPISTWSMLPCARPRVTSLTSQRSEEHTSELQSLAYLVC